MGDPSKDFVSPWQPMSRPIDVKHIGKLLEELGEAVTAVANYDVLAPIGARESLQAELADVLANIELCRTHFKLRVIRYTSPQDDRRRHLLIVLGDAIAAASRCLIQGIDGCEPTTGKCNREWLQQALSRLRDYVMTAATYYHCNKVEMKARKLRKKENLRRWHQALD